MFHLREYKDEKDPLLGLDETIVRAEIQLSLTAIFATLVLGHSFVRPLKHDIEHSFDALAKADFDLGHSTELFMHAVCSHHPCLRTGGHGNCIPDSPKRVFKLQWLHFQFHRPVWRYLLRNVSE